VPTPKLKLRQEVARLAREQLISDIEKDLAAVGDLRERSGQLESYRRDILAAVDDLFFGV
jgi:hypothetical protein